MSEAIEVGAHAPDPEFTRHLEWQVRTELRRQQRFGPSAAEAGVVWRAVRAALVIAFALAVGAGSVVAAQQWRRSREAELLIERTRVEQHIASARADAAARECEQLSQLVTGGFASDQELADCEQRVFAAKLELARLECDVAEIAASGREPNDRVSAARAGGRDFVRERTELELAIAMHARERADERVGRAELLNTQGFVSDSELTARRSDALAAALDVERRQRTLELRQRFLAGDLDAAHAELEELRIAGETKLRAASDALRRAEADAARAATLAERGVVSDVERLRAESALTQARAAEALARLELGLIEERAGR